MRSIQLVAPRTLEERTLPDPRDPGPGELLLKVRSVGICGSDMHWYADGHIGTTKAGYPQVLGHEALAEVVRVGPGVTGFREGDRVAAEPTLSCGHCEMCVSGRHNICLQNLFMGGPYAHGFFLDYTLLPAHNASLVPDSVSDRAATLVEPVAIIAQTVQLVRIKPGDTVGITGAGPIGMLCAAVARASGASRIYICDRLHHRLELAMRMGADIACDFEAYLEVIRDETRGRGVDVALEASGAVEAINASLAAARLGGTVALIGLSSDLTLPIDVHQAMAKELRVQAIRRSNHCTGRALQLIERGLISDKLITHQFPLAQTPKAFETLGAYADGVGKVMIEVNS